MTTEAMRAQFEAWVLVRGLSVDKRLNGYYQSDEICFWWKLWKDASSAALRSPAVAGLVEALEAVAGWKLPETGETWPSGAPVSYETNNGSIGVRAYMRSVAHEAIAQYATLTKGEEE